MDSTAVLKAWPSDPWGFPNTFQEVCNYFRSNAEKTTVCQFHCADFALTIQKQWWLLVGIKAVTPNLLVVVAFFTSTCWQGGKQLFHLRTSLVSSKNIYILIM